MTELLSFFETMPDWHKLAWLLLCLFSCTLLEQFIPLFKFSYQKLKHDAFNIGLFAMNGIIVAPLAIVLAIAAVWSESNQIGLLYHVDLPVWMELLLAILFLDLIAQYAVHYLLHHVKWMWRLHIVHHADTGGIRYGLDIMDDSRDLDLMYQLKAPIDRSIDTSHRPGIAH